MDLDEDEWVLLTQDREGWATHEAEYAESLLRNTFASRHETDDEAGGRAPDSGSRAGAGT